MGYLKAVLVALVGGVLLAAAVLAVEMVHAESVMASQMTNCHTNVGSDRSDAVCDAATQVGGVELPLAFGFGFAATFAWFLRDRDGPLRGQRLGRFM